MQTEHILVKFIKFFIKMCSVLCPNIVYNIGEKFYFEKTNKYNCFFKVMIDWCWLITIKTNWHVIKWKKIDKYFVKQYNDYITSVYTIKMLRG